MNYGKAQHDYKNALHAHSLAVENLQQAKPEEKQEAIRLEAQAWHILVYARSVITRALIESEAG